MHPTRVRLLLSAGHSCYRPRRTGERKRKSVRGCIVGMDLSVLALAIVKQGEQDIRDVGEGWPAILAALKTLLETNRPLAGPGHYAPRTPARA